MITKEKAREIAARIWCDPEYSHVVMNPDLAEDIANMLYAEARMQAWKEPIEELITILEEYKNP